MKKLIVGFAALAGLLIVTPASGHSECPNGHVHQHFSDAAQALQPTEDVCWFLAGGNDFVQTSPDYAYVLGQQGQDVLYGGGGFDFLAGNGGADQLYGGEGPDHLFGGDGSDGLNGGGTGISNRDSIYDGEGYDTITGDQWDVWFKCQGDGEDDVSGFEGTIDSTSTFNCNLNA